MSLYTQTRGGGRDIVLLHGWGLHGGIFEEVATTLTNRFRVTQVDLPGHGFSNAVPFPDEVSRLAAQIAAAVPAHAHWLGWSLGGLAAMGHAIARRDEPRSLILVATTPRFTAARDWPGMDAATLAAFAAGLNSEYIQTLRRFFALQVQGGIHRTAQLRRLNDLMSSRPAAGPTALAAGLSVLSRTDLRAQLNTITSPALLLYGERDRIVPAAAGGAVAQYLPQSRLHYFPRAGHAPFLSHPDKFIAIVEAWVDEH
jgi:pimeloyl-[acyl-carrier protein] methyl ester esterase